MIADVSPHSINLISTRFNLFGKEHSIAAEMYSTSHNVNKMTFPLARLLEKLYLIAGLNCDEKNTPAQLTVTLVSLTSALQSTQRALDTNLKTSGAK